MKHPKKTEFARLREQSRLSVSEAAGRLCVSARTIYRWEKGESEPGPLVLSALEDAAPWIPERLHPAPTFRFVDLFAGIGGLRLAVEAAGGKCVFTSEWDMACRETYRENFGPHEISGDITGVDPDDIPEHELLVAGFPCQPFSIAGVSKKNALGRPHGFRCDTQGTLFFDVASIIERKQPAAFLLENVKNLVTHDGGNTFRIIVRTLTEELGYAVDWKVINARGWVPQHRERIFIVGFRKDVGFSFAKMPLRDPNQGPKLGAILHPEDGSEEADGHYTVGPKASVNPKYTLSEHLWTYLQNYAAKHRERGNGFGFGLCTRESVARTLSARYYKDGSEILIEQPGRGPRRLTPRECARLMGFDTASRVFKIPVSDTQAYKQFGNSVVVPVATAVAHHMRPFIMKAVGGPAQLGLPFELRPLAAVNG